jgi:hypothetical protein
MKKQKSSRKYTKYPALCKNTLRRNVREYIDFDYIDQLSEDEKIWLNKFIEEYYCGKVKKGDKDALHKGKNKRQECYRRNNEINRDVHSICRNSKGFLDNSKYNAIVLGEENTGDNKKRSD